MKRSVKENNSQYKHIYPRASNLSAYFLPFPLANPSPIQSPTTSHAAPKPSSVSYTPSQQRGRRSRPPLLHLIPYIHTVSTRLTPASTCAPSNYPQAPCIGKTPSKGPSPSHTTSPHLLPLQLPPRRRHNHPPAPGDTTPHPCRAATAVQQRRNRPHGPPGSALCTCPGPVVTFPCPPSRARSRWPWADRGDVHRAAGPGPGGGAEEEEETIYTGREAVGLGRSRGCRAGHATRSRRPGW